MWFLCLLFLAACAQAELKEARCPDDAYDCHFTLLVDYGVTMMAGKVLVKAKGGRLYRYDDETYNVSNSVPIQEVVTADGHPEPRLIMTFNGSIPGPALHVTRGQTVHLTVINKMLHESTTVHIHGQYQRGTQFSDGVPFVTQCPISPGQTFVQTFKADPAGTFFYHSHSGPQMTNGLYGPFIVHPSLGDLQAAQDSNQTVQHSTQTAKNSSQKSQEHILMFQDWNHNWDSNMVTMKMRLGMYSEGVKIDTSNTLAGVHYSAFHFHSGLINGRGRFHNSTGGHNEAPLSEFLVTPGAQHRLRLISPADVLPFRVSIDSHLLQVVATDGHDIQPVLVESVTIHPGERYDVIVTANQSVDNYWIRAVTLEVEHNNRFEAILRYAGAPNVDPQSSQKGCSADDPCLVLNCPFSYYPLGSHTYCYNYGQIESLTPHVLKPAPGRGIKEVFLNFAFPGTTETPGSVNGRSFVNQHFAALSKSGQPSTCSRDQCGEEQICHCPYAISYDQGDLVQLVFHNLGSGSGWDHPIHMHGHSFQVVKVGYPNYNTSSGTFVSANSDIHCFGNFCNNATWANASWSGGNLPGADTVLGPLKDDIVVPSGGYVVVRFEADNPGLWMIHCHIELHMTDGMAALLNESSPLWPSPPPGFPACGDFYG